MCISALYRSMKAKTIIWINPAVNRNKVQQHFTKKFRPFLHRSFHYIKKKRFRTCDNHNLTKNKPSKSKQEK